MNLFDLLAFGFAVLPVLYLLVVALPLARTDLREHRLPNRLTLPGLWIALSAQTLASLVLAIGFLASGSSAGKADLWQSVAYVGFVNQLGALAVAAIVFAASLAAHVWWRLGMGDVKLLTVISLSLGWFSPWLPLLALVVGFAVALVGVLAGLLTRRIKLSSSVALGPFLLIGFAVASSVAAAAKV
jgi:leader peptidase (prepilin peptidase)/N-methyltransferase